MWPIGHQINPVFSYPVYTFIAPYQLHLFIEKLKKHNFDFSGKVATQITTSKHFYDVTAHKYIEENSLDFGMKYIPGLSADMEDLLSEKGQNDLNHFFTRFLWATKENIFTVPKSKQEMPKLANIKNSPTEDDVKKSLETNTPTDANI